MDYGETSNKLMETASRKQTPRCDNPPRQIRANTNRAETKLCGDNMVRDQTATDTRMKHCTGRSRDGAPHQVTVSARVAIQR